jgi:putative effector of murein hydrolase LrgA (UPF0299 family)
MIFSLMLPGRLFGLVVLFYFLWGEVKKAGWIATYRNTFVFTSVCLNVAGIMGGLLLVVDDLAPIAKRPKDSGTLLFYTSQFLELAGVGCHVHLLSSRISSFLTPMSQSLKLFNILVGLCFFFLVLSLISTVGQMASVSFITEVCFMVSSALFVSSMSTIDVISTYLFHKCIKNIQSVLKEQSGASSQGSLVLIAAMGVRICCNSLIGATFCSIALLFGPKSPFYPIGILIACNASIIGGVLWLIMRIQLEKLKARTSDPLMKHQTTEKHLSTPRVDVVNSGQAPISEH